MVSCGGLSRCHLLLAANAAGSSAVLEPTWLLSGRSGGGREAGRVAPPPGDLPHVTPSQAVWKQLSGRPECGWGMSPLLSRGGELFWPVDQPALLGGILIAPREYMRPAAHRPCKSGAVPREIPGDSSELKAKPRGEAASSLSSLVAERSPRVQQNAVPMSAKVREMDPGAGSARRRRWGHESI